MMQSAETRRNLHTHTDSFLKSLKQIGTICFTFSFLIFPNFASAENIPTTNPGCTTTVLGAQNIANGSAALEPDFSANTINTTWYSNGTQLTGNNIPATCTYDDAFTPPTPADRPGYTFGGWRLRCVIPSENISIAPTKDAAHVRWKNHNAASQYTMEAYLGTENSDDLNPGEWVVLFSYGEVRGQTLCSSMQGTDSPRSTFATIDTTNGQYCWCKATHYTANEAQQCTLTSTLWTYLARSGICDRRCAQLCALIMSDMPGIKRIILTGTR